MNFPKELAALPQWICWRLEPDPKSEKPRKVPYDPKTGRKASSTNPQTWATLAEAEAARQKCPAGYGADAENGGGEAMVRRVRRYVQRQSALPRGE